MVATDCRELEQLGGLASLRQLELYRWPLPSLAPLGGLALKRLVLQGGALATLEGMPPVERLELKDLGALRSLAPLAAQVGLRSLRIDGLGKAGPLPSLAGLRKLKRVVLVATAFDDFGPLAQAPELTELAVCNTSVPTVESFRPLAGHRRLSRAVVGLKSARKNRAVSALLGDLPEFDYWE
jgi:hypothetical protein